MVNAAIEESVRTGRNVQALVLIREQLGCSLVEAVDVLDGVYRRLEAEQPSEQPNWRAAADEHGRGQPRRAEDQAADQCPGTDS
ncbi:hypothetical protein [Micromonospora sp. NPDC049497]|uniref:hypothetical protein n=1 Tax=Micromonospora sp. NPDC049497 TaxID=3364273 RepID=UPI0037A611E5